MVGSCPCLGIVCWSDKGRKGKLKRGKVKGEERLRRGKKVVEKIKEEGDRGRSRAVQLIDYANQKLD